MSEQIPVAVLGAGAFGTALAIQLSRRGAPAFLWGRDATTMATIQESRENAVYLKGCALPAPLIATSDLARVVAESGDIVIATPSHSLRETCERLSTLLRPEQGVACAAKGLEPGSGRLAHEVIGAALGVTRSVAVISGPTFAKELGLGLPTAVTVASNDPAFAERMALRFHGDGFRAYTSRDLIGVEIGGAAKNVLAIAVGIADGLGLGANTRAAMITRGLNEITRLATALGAEAETLMGMAGLGDLVLTCTDNQSRNRRYGIQLGEGATPEQARAAIEGVVEGVRAAPEVLRLAHRLGVDMPLLEMAGAVIAGQVSPIEALKRLAERPLRAELG
ncbi:NAD(P)H-dependent glycerol-3-phosphate dehydrogenase [uncultured Nevskia sp.]|uniref:NAD(P)H-dependent glycerol-3-phosphate dehydrogenase n=1 Tax=uncultured Nevskia sp. TaxID=228950 RepID=UPI0025F4114C|nr:NAD(P)H-dependent glycerol-3-phosphate dehydrogenase [uncultured Nevskia sp.]